MFFTNPFYVLSQSISPIFMKVFVLLMIALIIVGTVMDMIHKKNVKYFLKTQKSKKKCNQNIIIWRKNKGLI